LDIPVPAAVHAFADPENKIAFRVRNEPNGTIGSAEREIAAIGGRDL
jgi:hypothetical protein